MPASRAFAGLFARPLLLLTALFVLSLPLVTTRLYASDEVQYFSYLRSLWFDRDVSFENEYRHFYESGVVRYDGFRDTFLVRQTDTGLRHSFATMGSAVLWSPFYGAADALVRVRRAMGSPVEADGYAQPYIAAVAYGSAFYGWLTLVLSVLIAQRVLRLFGDGGIRANGHGSRRDRVRGDDDRADRERARGDGVRGDGDGPSRARARSGGARDGDARVALGAAIAVWIGTPLFFYTYIAPPMSHACSAFAIALFVYVWLRVRERWSAGGMALLGALAALMAMVREQDVFVVIGPAIDWALTVARPALRPVAGAESRAAANHANAVHAMSAPAISASAAAPAAAAGARTRLVINAVAGIVAFAVVYAPQAWAYVALNGYLGPSRLVGRKMNWMAPHAIEVLLSPRHGLLFWTPLVLLSLAGLTLLAFARRGPSAVVVNRHHARRGTTRGAESATGGAPVSRDAGHDLGHDVARDTRRIGLGLLLMVLTQVYVAGSVDSWTVAGAFGQRRFVGLSAILALGLAVLFARLPARAPRRVGLAVAALTIWWNLGLMAQFGAGLMDRQRLELGRNAYHTFVTIPRRLPELAYRYVFERRSFFKGTA